MCALILLRAPPVNYNPNAVVTSKQQPSELICTVPDTLARAACIEEDHEILDISGTHAARTAQIPCIRKKEEMRASRQFTTAGGRIPLCDAL